MRVFEVINGVRHYECRSCLKLKPETAFDRKSPPSRCGRRSNCKVCERTRLREWRSLQSKKSLMNVRREWHRPEEVRLEKI